MTIANEKPLDLQYSLPVTGKEKLDSDPNPESNLDDLDDFFNSGMAHTGQSSPFIKDEPEDFSFLANNYPPNQKGFDMQVNQHFGETAASSVDPSDLSMQNGSFNQYGMGGPQNNMSNSFNLGNSGIHDDELLDLDLNDTTNPNFNQNPNGFGAQGHVQNYFPNQNQTTNGQGQAHQIYSHTPDGAPIQSPFNQPNFHYNLNQMHNQQIAQNAQHMRPNALGMHGQSLDTGFMNARARASMAPPMERHGSDSRSPMTPRTPGMSALHLSTPESGSLTSQPIRTNYSDRRHQKTMSGTWDGNTGSLPSAVDSPIGSPFQANSNAQMSEILKSGKHASLPAKTESHHAPGYQTQEAKRRRRRESHNQVERRRRDNINEKIHELSQLVPDHRLEDEKVRKHLMNNSPLSPTLAATGISPPQATSLLAGGGRRAAGSISMGIPPEDKDKAPNKGDILNGAVSWTRDLMWALHVKIQQEDELKEYIQSIGGQFPFQQTDDENRMRTELLTAMQDNGPSSFSYTRSHGSGLRVPHHTTPSGEPLSGTLSPSSTSPGRKSSGETNPQQPYGPWNPTFKEEDEYNNMEMS